MRRMRRIYIAGKFEAKERLKKERLRIEVPGYGVVVGTWLDQEETCDMGDARRMSDHARRDILQVRSSDLLIQDTQDENRTGGANVECGIALGAGIEVWTVGPRRNVFHHLTPNFPDWDAAIEALGEYLT